MIINHIKGDLFTTQDSYIAHGCNAQGVMGSGIAKIVRDEYPESYKAYVDKKLYLSLGMVFHGPKEKDHYIIHCITQNHYGRGGRFVSYDAICECFETINSKYTGSKISIPMIGAGLGGGDWDIIEKIIDKSTPNVDITVYQL